MIVLFPDLCKTIEYTLKNQILVSLQHVIGNTNLYKAGLCVTQNLRLDYVREEEDTAPHILVNCTTTTTTSYQKLLNKILDLVRKKGFTY